MRALSPLPHQAAALLEAERRLAFADSYTRMPALLALAELLLAAQRLVKPLVAALADTALRTAGTDTEDGAA